jgi:hypothetical protein
MKFGEASDGTSTGGAEERDLVARHRDADERDAVADARDAVAGARDLIADAREARLDEWERQLEARARAVGFVTERYFSAEERGRARAERDLATSARAAVDNEREQARAERDGIAAAGPVNGRATLLAAAFAGIAEHLHEAKTPDEVLTRVAQAAITTVVGSDMASVTLPDGDTYRTAALSGPGPGAQSAGSVLSYHLQAPLTPAEEGGAALHIYSSSQQAFDEAAQEVGFILAAHASLAVRDVGERVTLETLNNQLQRALLSRDVIGQAKGILMERLRVTPEEAFDILTRSSQRLNVKLREVAQTLTETGDVDPEDLRRS